MAAEGRARVFFNPDCSKCRTLRGLLEERGVARADYPIAAAGETVGVVTSGAPSFSLGKSIGLGYVAPAHAEVGSRIDIVIRNRAIAARVVETPFVRAPKKQG